MTNGSCHLKWGLCLKQRCGRVAVFGAFHIISYHFRTPVYTDVTSNSKPVQLIVQCLHINTNVASGSCHMQHFTKGISFPWEFPFIARKWLVALGDCTNSSYILYHFILFKGSTVVQAVDPQHFHLWSTWSIPGQPMWVFCGGRNFTWRDFSPRVSVVPSQYYPVNNSYSIYYLWCIIL